MKTINLNVIVTLKNNERRKKVIIIYNYAVSKFINIARKITDTCTCGTYAFLVKLVCYIASAFVLIIVFN